MVQLRFPWKGTLRPVPQSRRGVPLQPGLEPFPGYRLRRYLGQGGFGEVWEAHVTGGAPAALKFMYCDGRATPREIRGLQLVRQFSHPNLISIRLVWCYQNYIVTAMELAEGDLDDLYHQAQEERGMPPPATTLCRYLAQAADALDFLNLQHHTIDGQRVAIRHCDVKPSNLLLVGDTLKVSDFGLAAMTTFGQQGDRRGGTPEYAAPEVFRNRMTPTTDQYSLAVTYCQLRTGRLPFGDTPHSFRTSYMRPAPDLSLLTDRERPIVARALSAAPQLRWPTCTEFIAQLSRATA